MSVFVFGFYYSEKYLYFSFLVLFACLTILLHSLFVRVLLKNNKEE